jgi:RNA polymerase sigma factor (sigma-70 family)
VGVLLCTGTFALSPFAWSRAPPLFAHSRKIFRDFQTFFTKSRPTSTVLNVVINREGKREKNFSDTKAKARCPLLICPLRIYPQREHGKKGAYCKGSALLPFVLKGARKMKRKDRREHTRHSFDAYCKKISKHKAFDRWRTIRRRSRKEVLFSEISDQDLAAFAVTDRYLIDDYAFDILGGSVEVTDAELAEALGKLPADERGIVLMSYFANMTDRQIAQILHRARRTVAHHRAAALGEMRDYLESED